MADNEKPPFTGRMRTPKQFEVARIQFTAEECRTHEAWANANDGIVDISVKESKAGKQYMVIDTFRKNIPEQFGGEQTSNNNQQQQTSTYTPKYKSNNDYKNDAPPSMPVNKDDDDLGGIPF